MCGKTNLNKSFAVAGRLIGQLDKVLATPAETSGANRELRGLCLEKFGEKARDARHRDAETIHDHEGHEAIECTNDIVPGMDQ